MPIISLIEENSQITGNKSGISVANLCGWSKLSASEVRLMLNKLYKEGKITVREGVNGKLIFRNDE